MISRKARPRPVLKDSMENTACRTLTQNPDCIGITNSTETLLQKHTISRELPLLSLRGTAVPVPCPGTAPPPPWPHRLPGRGAGGLAVPASAAAPAPPRGAPGSGGHGRRGECERHRGTPPGRFRGQRTGPGPRGRLRGQHWAWGRGGSRCPAGSRPFPAVLHGWTEPAAAALAPSYL